MSLLGTHYPKISPSYLKGTPSHVLPVVLRIEKTLNQNNALFSNIYSTLAKPARHKQEHHGAPFQIRLCHESLDPVGENRQ